VASVISVFEPCDRGGGNGSEKGIRAINPSRLRAKRFGAQVSSEKGTCKRGAGRGWASRITQKINAAVARRSFNAKTPRAQRRENEIPPIDPSRLRAKRFGAQVSSEDHASTRSPPAALLPPPRIFAGEGGEGAGDEKMKNGQTTPWTGGKLRDRADAASGARGDLTHAEARRRGAARKIPPIHPSRLRAKRFGAQVSSEGA
jgi:hypothetical protein